TEGIALTSAQSPASSPAAIPQLPPTMPGAVGWAVPTGAGVAAAVAGPPSDIAPIAAVGDDTEIVFIVRSKRDPVQRSEVYVVDQAAPDLVARITHAARASGEQRAALARVPVGREANHGVPGLPFGHPQPPLRTAAANQLPGSPPVVRGQTAEY